MTAKQNRLRILAIIAVLTVIFSNFQPSAAQAQSGDGLKRQVNPESGKLNFLGPENERALSASKVLGTFARPQDPAMALAKRFGPEFGLKNPERDLSELKRNDKEDGRWTVRYQQEYQGIPVMGGELIVNTNERGDLYSMNGEISPDLVLSTQPTIDAVQARYTALQSLAKWYQKTPEDFTTTEPELWIFDESLLQPSTRPSELVWRMEVTSRDGSLPVRELVLVNAERGGISLHFNQMDTAWGGTNTDVVALDNQGSPVPDVSVTITAPANGSSGSFADTGSSITTLTTDAMGIAAPTFIANSALGGYALVVSANDLESVNFTLENIDTTWFVATTGSDTNNCQTPLTPCLTINAAIGKALDGDVIKVAEGIYTGDSSPVVNILKSLVLSGGWDHSFTTQNSTSTLDGVDKTRVGVIISSSSVELMVSLERFTIQNSRYGVMNSETANLRDLNILNNNTGGWYDNGGGINNHGNMTIVNTTISGNVASGGGGGIYNDGYMVLENTTISGNTASLYGGGAIYNYNNGIDEQTTHGVLRINNSTIVNNVSSNSQVVQGGGIKNYGTVTISNSILANKFTPAGLECNGNSLISLGYNLVRDSSGCPFSSASGDQVGSSDYPLDPKITNLQNNGGLTLTHALIGNSPALNGGNPATPGDGADACTLVDQRDIGRPVDARCDIGAFEGSIPWTPSPRVRTYTASNTSSLPGSFLCDQSQLNCTNNANPHADGAHKHAIGAYNFYSAKHQRDGIDNLGMAIISTVHYCGPNLSCPYDNAYWSGTQMVYGGKYGYPLADDIVMHELTHGVTEYESNLFYYYQSGAINESLSDLWGEYYDQINRLGNDPVSGNWLLGEDVSNLGTIRSMSNPPAYGDPDSMSSSYYYEGADDSGGVHTNSGVNNKAVYLMVDGGTFNGKIVTALGWEKTAAVYYEVNTRLLTSGADYSDLYYAVQRACANLIGQKGITSGDCIEVKDALDAVEMNDQPAPNFNTEALLCPPGQTVNTIFYDDFETEIGFWQLNDRWMHGSAYGPYAHSGNHFLYADDYPPYISTSGSRLHLPVLAIPNNAYLAFHHAYDFESYMTSNSSYYFDGGILQYTDNNAESWHDAGYLMDYNGYKGMIYANWNNPLKGRYAFVDTSHGYISTRLNLSSFAGKQLGFEWIMGLDDSGYSWGWWLDDVRLYTCGPSTIFADVPNTYWSWSYIEGLYNAGVTGGCSNTPRNFCPTTTVTRDQMAVFLLRGKHGSGYSPPLPSGVFGDIPTNHWAAAWIEQLAAEGITAGCGSGNFCPTLPVTRDQMAVFLLRAKHGSGYSPPIASGVFGDVPLNHWAAPWIEQLAAEGITAGCGSGNFCPATPVTRDQMAVFLVRTFNLPLP